MRSFIVIIILCPQVNISLQVFQGSIYLLSESCTIKLILHCPAEAFASVCLRTFSLCFAVFHVLYGKIELIFVVLWLRNIHSIYRLRYASRVCHTCQKNGMTVSLSISAAVKAVLRSYSLANATFE
ncbi:hypothetical protein EZS27_035824 [termite gut metagenome]|uniref:Uncharacterized protein n=1 Tax=termite gut metagenome TaxID=433724 RepID=A0A5J4PXL9_9ZZZZ